MFFCCREQAKDFHRRLLKAWKNGTLVPPPEPVEDPTAAATAAVAPPTVEKTPAAAAGIATRESAKLVTNAVEEQEKTESGSEPGSEPGFSSEPELETSADLGAINSTGLRRRGRGRGSGEGEGGGQVGRKDGGLISGEAGAFSAVANSNGVIKLTGGEGDGVGGVDGSGITGESSGSSNSGDVGTTGEGEKEVSAAAAVAAVEVPHPGALPENVYNNGLWQVR